MSSPPLQVFISYRRDDTADAAGRLYDALTKEFGERVFMDIDTIEPGVDFVDVVHRAVKSCDVLLALIGNRWAGVADEKGKHRLDDPDDFVRLEIEAALDRDVRVIPVLLQGATMPSSEELPPPLARLVRRNAIEISSSRWQYDVGRLTDTLRKLADEKATSSRQNEDPPSSRVVLRERAASADRRRRNGVVAAAAAALVLLAVGLAFLVGGGSDPSPGGSSAAGAPADAVPLEGNSVVEINPDDGSIIGSQGASAGPASVVQDFSVGLGSIWVRGTGGISRIDLSMESAAVPIIVTDPTDIGVGTSGVWVTHEDRVSPIDQDTNVLGNAIQPGIAPRRVAVGTSVWVLTSGPTAGDQRDELVKLNADGSEAGSVQIPGDDLVVPQDIGVWIADTDESHVVHIDPNDLSVLDTVPLPDAPDGIAPGTTGVWTFNTEARTITEIRMTSDGVEVRSSILLEARPIALSVGLDAIWTANEDGTISKIVGGTVVDNFDLGRPAISIRGERESGRIFVLIG